MQVTVTLAPGIDDREVSALARARGVLVSPLSAYYGAGPPQSGLLLGFCPYTEEEIKANISVLGEVLSAQAN